MSNDILEFEPVYWAGTCRSCGWAEEWLMPDTYVTKVCSSCGSRRDEGPKLIVAGVDREKGILYLDSQEDVATLPELEET